MTQTCYQDSLALRVGSFLKNELKARGISQAAFAEAIYVDERTVRRWIHSGVDRLSNVEDIAGYFHVSAGEVISYGDDFPLLYAA